MPTQIFVNVPVKNLERSMAFYRQLGYTFDPQFTNADAACMFVDERIYVMLLTEPFFQGFTKKAICDAHASTEAILCLSLDSRAAVDALAEKAVAAGAAPVPAQDHGFMYQRNYEDPDGHQWELVHMQGTPDAG